MNPMRLLVSKILLLTSNLFLTLTRYTSRVVAFLDSFIVVTMTPEEMLEYGKRAYGNRSSHYGDSRYVKQGLMPWEKDVIEKYAARRGNFLVLGSGGGRESIALAKMGFKVVGVDSCEHLIKMAKINAAKEGVDIVFRMGDLMKMPPSEDKFDYCMLSCIMYSAIPTRKLRVEALSMMRQILNDGGLAIIHFLLNPERNAERLFKLRKFIAKIFNGNPDYQLGDTFITQDHFLRVFQDEQQVIGEIKESNFSIKDIGNDSPSTMYAVLEKI